MSGTPSGAGGGGAAGSGGNPTQPGAAGAGGAPGGAGGAPGGSAANLFLLDSHVHFFDPSRPIPAGRNMPVPWPDAASPLYQRTLPDDFWAIAKPLGVLAAVAVEASPWLEDNDWLLDIASGAPGVLACIGNLSSLLGSAELETALAQHAESAIFRGLRLLASDLGPESESAVRALAARGMTLDVLGYPSDLQKIAELAESVPNLKLVLDHCGNVPVDGRAPASSWAADLRALAARPNVFCKVSGLVEATDRLDGAPSDIEHYRPTFDVVWNAFGQERVLFASNWPVSSLYAPLETVVAIARAYFEAKGSAAAERFFATNARLAYGL